MLTEEKTFEFAKEKGFDKILKAFFIEGLTYPEVMTRFGKTNNLLDIEIRVMCALDLTKIIETEKGRYGLIITERGRKLLDLK